MLPGSVVIFKVMIPRERLIQKVMNAVSDYPVTLLSGPRQCGKTTLARQIWEQEGGEYFDLEDPETPLQPERASLVLKDLKGLVIIDEFQHQPDLFPLLRVLADREPLPARFLVLGSASLDLVRGVSETLAGRVSYVRMGGFSLDEIGDTNADRLWIRGRFPRSYLAQDNSGSFEWRSNFIQSFLERDIPQLGIRIPAVSLRRFWTMAAHYHAQVWNAAEFARSLGSKEDTARKYLDVLTGTFLIRQVPPWFENIGKRLVKSPKVYIRDTGILHALLGMKSKRDILSHPKLGFSWESFALEEVLTLWGLGRDAYFFKTHAGAALDLMVVEGNRRFGFEFKYQDAPRTSRSMHTIIDDLNLERLWIVYPGGKVYPLRERIDVVPLSKVGEVLKSNGLVEE